MSVASLAAFARMHAAHEAFVASYRTDQRPAAIAELEGAEVEFIAQLPGTTVWVRADDEPSGMIIGQVSEAYDRGDVRTEHGVITWGNFCLSTCLVRQAKDFFAAAERALDAACALDAAG